MTSEDEQSTSNYFGRHRRTSTGVAGTRLSLSKSSVHRVLRNRQYLIPYRLHIFQKFEQLVYEAGIDDSSCGTENIEVGSLTCYFFDELVFHVDGKVNKQNVMI